MIVSALPSFVVSWDALTALATSALVVLGILTLVYARIQIADFREENRIKHLIDLVTQFEAEPIASMRARLAKERLSEGRLLDLNLSSPPVALYDIINFFEHVGFLLDGSYLSLEGVSVEFHYWILNVWADAHDLVKQEQLEDPIYYEFFEKMVNRLLEYDRPRTGKLKIPSKEDIEAFYLDETKAAPGGPISRGKRISTKKAYILNREEHALNLAKTAPKLGVAVDFERRDSTTHPVSFLYLVLKIYNAGEAAASELKGSLRLVCPEVKDLDRTVPFHVDFLTQAEPYKIEEPFGGVPTYRDVQAGHFAGPIYVEIEFTYIGLPSEKPQTYKQRYTYDKVTKRFMKDDSIGL